jgi:hypothetical protein
MRRRIAAASASILLLTNAAPVFADTTIEISGNGADTTNTAKVNQTNTTTVVQDNKADVTNYIEASADTGENDANRNTGGDVSVETGDATTDVEVMNMLNGNSANVDNCDCDGDVDVLISENGDNSTNKVKLDSDDTTGVFQYNKAKVMNKVDAEAETGENDANRNTGGDVTVDTGDATTDVDVVTMANKNVASVGNGGDGNGGTVSARIVGNGADTYNKIKLDLDRIVLVDQDNKARIKNKVKADAETGENDANRNTGGEVGITTGDADVAVGVDNMVNFNWADVDCGCLFDITAKIAGNGYNADSMIKADIADDLDVFQYNKDKTKNKVKADGETGENDANRNTGDPDGDPYVDTGDADTEVMVGNSGNFNTYGGDGDGFEWPDHGHGGHGGTSVHVDFNLGDLLELLGLV